LVKKSFSAEGQNIDKRKIKRPQTANTEQQSEIYFVGV